MKPARSVVFWVLAALLVIGHAVVAWHSLVTLRFWEDEALNLTVPLNLIDGLGYASDGALSGSVITPFDPRISTGHAVLLPAAAVLATGIDPIIGARLIPLLYWVLLLAGLWVLGRRICGRWAALLAVAVPLAFNAGIGVSPIQGPTDLLGEIPAAALIVWALVVLPRRAWLAGLLLGLAVQAKLIALLALPAFAVALFVLSSGTSTGSVTVWKHVVDTLRRGRLPLIMVGVPTLLVEIFALISLGPSAFVEHLRALRSFVRSGGQGGAPTTVPQKLQTLFESWFTWSWVAVLATAVGLLLLIAGLVLSRRSLMLPEFSDRVSLLAASAVGALAFIGWWTTASHLPLWVRHPAPGIYAFIPLLAAGAVWGAAVLARRGLIARILGLLGIAVVAVAVAASASIHVAQQFMPRALITLDAQRVAVEPIREWVAETGTEWLAAEPWGAAVAPIVMSGAHVGLFDAPSMRDAPRLTGLECTTKTFVDTGYYRVCAAPGGE